MGLDKKINQPDWKKLDKLIEEGLQRVSKKLIEHEKKNNGYLIIGDQKGNILEVPAKDL